MKPLTIDDISDKTKKFPVVDGPFGTQLHADEYVSEGIPVIRITNLSYQGAFISDDIVFITEEKAKELRRSEIVKDDIIIAKTGATIGKSAKFPFESGIIASSCLKVSLDKEIVDSDFLHYLITSYEGQRKIIDGATGSTRTTINIGPFKKITFNFPDKPEQTRISEILSKADEAITHTEALIAKYQRIKTGLMQDLLTKGIDEHGNIRSKETHKFVVKNGIEVPKEWEVENLENITRSTITYGIVQAGPDIPNGIPYIRTGDMSGDVLSVNGLLRTSIEIASKFKRSQVEEGDIVFALRATIGKVLIVPKELNGANLTQGTARIAPDLSIIYNLYLLWTMRMSYFTNQILQIQKGTTFFEITLGELRKMIVSFPKNIDEQLRIINMIESQESSILNLKSNLNKLQSLKTGLMKDLLSGKVRVNMNNKN